MYLQQVYRHNKWMFAAILLFILGQGIINFNHGAVFSPFYLYGMYSEKIPVNKQYEVIVISCNGRQLRGEDFSIQEWDKILVPVYSYLSSDSINNQNFTLKNRLLNKLHLHTTQTRNEFSNEGFTPAEFIHWYQGYLSEITGTQIDTLSISHQQFAVQSARLSLLANSNKLLFPEWSSAQNKSGK